MCSSLFDWLCGSGLATEQKIAVLTCDVIEGSSPYVWHFWPIAIYLCQQRVFSLCVKLLVVLRLSDKKVHKRHRVISAWKYVCNNVANCYCAVCEQCFS